MRLRALTLVPVLLAAPTIAGAVTRQVSPGKTYADPCAAIAAATAGDVIEVDASTTYTSTCAWSTDNLTIKGVGGLAKIDLTNKALAGGKGIFVPAGDNVTFESLELTGARLTGPGANGAGIRHQGKNLTVRGCYFHDNDDGILGAPATSGTGDVIIESSEFAKNGAGDGLTHNMYLGDYASFTLTKSYSHHAVVGHLVKSRALRNVVAYNRITDEDGTASYELNFPQGGLTYVIGNLIQQSATTDNAGIVSYGEEGSINPDLHLFVVNNTVVNDRAAGGTFVLDATSTAATIMNNIFVGAGNVTTQGNAVLTTNHTDADGDPMLVARATFDYHLTAGSPAIDKGTAPGMNGADPLGPTFEYAQPENAVTRSVVGSAIDIGAFEFGNVPNELPDGGSSSSSGSSGQFVGNVPVGDPLNPPGSSGGGSSSSGSSGCGCAVPGSRTAGGAGALALVAIALLARRRRQNA